MKFLLPKALLFSAVAATIFSSMTTALAQDEKVDPNVAAAKTAQAILDSATWADLFNGKDLTGWTGDLKGYAAQDGILICNKGGKHLYTEKEYSDFALHFEFKLEESGNNGIGIRVPKDGHPSKDGMEIQILDHDGKVYNGDALWPTGRLRS